MEKNVQTYATLADIRQRKEDLLSSIRNDDNQMRTLWGQLFRKPDMLTSTSPTKRLSSLMSTSVGVLDAAIVGWKLYRKFYLKDGKSKRRKRK